MGSTGEDYDATLEGRVDRWASIEDPPNGYGCLAQVVIVLVAVAVLLGATFGFSDARSNPPFVTPAASPTTLPATTVPPTPLPVSTTLPLFDPGPEFTPQTTPPPSEPSPEPSPSHGQ